MQPLFSRQGTIGVEEGESSVEEASSAISEEGEIREEIEKLTEEIKAAVINKDFEQLERLAGELMIKQEEELLFSLKKGVGEDVFIIKERPSQKSAITVIETIREEGKVPGIPIGDGEFLSFDKAIEGIKNGYFRLTKYLFYKRKTSFRDDIPPEDSLPDIVSIVLYSTPEGLKEKFASSSIVVEKEEKYGGISLEGIETNTTPVSSPVNIPVLNLQEWKKVAFRIIDLRSILDLPLYLGIISYGDKEREELTYFEEMSLKG